MKMTAEQKSWALYDVGNSAYQLVIVTAIFPLYYAGVVKESFFIAGHEFSPESMYLLLFSAAYLIVAVINPLLSGIADVLGNKRFFMSLFTLIGIAGTLFLCTLSEEFQWLGLLGAVISTVGYTGSIVFYNAFLTQVASKEEQDILSAKGYSWGYLGSMVLLVIALIPFVFNLMPSGLASKMVFLMVAIWWSVWSFRSINGLPVDKPVENGSSVFIRGYRELGIAVQKARSRRYIWSFLLSYFFYIMGVQTVFYAATLFGKQELKLEDNLLIVTMLLIQLLGAIGAVQLSRFAARKGNFVALFLTLFIWLGVTIYAYYIQTPVQFIAASIVVGFVMGGIQSLSRSSFAKWIYDMEDQACLFSLFDFMEKVGIVLGTISFAFFTDFLGSMRSAILVLIVFFVFGILLLWITRIFVQQSKA